MEPLRNNSKSRPRTSSVSGQDLRSVPYDGEPAGRPISASRPAPATNPNVDGADLTTISTVTPHLSYSSTLHSDESEATTTNEQPNPLASFATLRLPQSGLSPRHDYLRPLPPIPSSLSPPPPSSTVLGSTSSSDPPHSHGQRITDGYNISRPDHDEIEASSQERATEEQARKILKQNSTGAIDQGSPEWYLTKFMERSITPKGATGLLLSLRTNEIGWLQQLIAMKGMQVLVHSLSHMSRKGEQRTEADHQLEYETLRCIKQLLISWPATQDHRTYDLVPQLASSLNSPRLASRKLVIELLTFLVYRVPESITLITEALETVSITRDVDSSPFAYWFASFESSIYGRITPPPVETDPPVHPASTSHGPFTPPLESEPAPTRIASSPESPMAAAGTSCHNEAIHTQARAKVETPSPPVRPDVITALRTTVVGKQLAPLHGVPVPDIEVPSFSRSGIKGHLKKMMTPVGQRRLMTFSTRMNSQPTVQRLGLPTVRPEDHTTTSLKSNHSNVTTLCNSLIGSSSLGAAPGSRRGYQGYTRGPGVPPPSVQVSVASSVSGYTALNGNARLVITQDSTGQSRQSTAVSGQTPPQLTALSLDKSASRTVEKPVLYPARRVTGVNQGAPTGSIMRSATPLIATTRLAMGEKVNVTSAILSPIPANSIRRTSSISNIKHSALQTRKPIVMPEQVTSRLAVPSSVSGAVTSTASSVWNSTSRNPSRIKTKDLISRHHRQQNASTLRNRRRARIASPSKSPTSGSSATAPLAGKPDSSRIDSGIELWDYDPRGDNPVSNRIDSGIELWDYDPRGGNPVSNRIDSGIELWDYDPQGANPDSNRIDSGIELWDRGS